MRTYEFGDRHKPVVLLLPGTCCHWKNNFFNVIPYLERYFYVVCISYDGFDENEEATFPTMLEETEKNRVVCQKKISRARLLHLRMFFRRFACRIARAKASNQL